MTAKASPTNLSQVFSLGDSLRIDTPLTADQSLIVDQMREWSPPSLSPMVDYDLANNAGDGSPMRLRIMRQENAEGSKAAILTLYDRFPYSEQFHDVVRSEFKHLAVHDSPAEDGQLAMFWRIRDAIGSHVSPVKLGRKAGPLTTSRIEFWDYSRLVDVNGVETEEFVFVELNKESGWFEIWRGIEVAPGKIAVL